MAAGTRASHGFQAALRASDAAPAAVRASVLSRLAFAYATTDRHTDFQRSCTIDRPLTGQRATLDVLALIHLGMSSPSDGITAKERTLLAQGIDLLQTGCAQPDQRSSPSTPSPL
ncbi:hypothetical protein [Nonomuraea jiangxiensis]|uniref:hypothetical protein n=1 Tax=Nonomuraea jiangxiensis TaxID=633440 RepID=UPI000B83BF4F|nr:hypothetical protein [Nonomuraea jiangxiensis]